MYPNLYFFLKEVFGIEIGVARFINTFGFFMALSFLGAAFVITKEFKRLEKEKRILPYQSKILIGEPASMFEIAINFLIGFILGYKLIGLFSSDTRFYFNAQQYLVSGEGNLIGGLLLGALLAFNKYYSKKKQQLKEPKWISIEVPPYQRVPDMVLITAVSGLLGAKIFHNLENMDVFLKDPIGELLSFGGLTFYGGLIFGTIAILYYGKTVKIGKWELIDAFAPTIMIAYAIGRLGCHFAGDGDWGILNSAFISNVEGQAMLAEPGQFQQALINNQDYYNYMFGSLQDVKHAPFYTQSLPSWLYAYSYPHNVLSEGFRFDGCEGAYCAFLPVPVYPTPLYESVLSFIAFGVIWVMRKRIKIYGHLACLFLLLNGIERFFIEKIRVNTQYHLGGLSFSQAELISLSMVILAIIIFFIARKNHFSKLLK